MLRLIIGRAGTGKTAAVIGEIARAVAEGRGGSMLIVPEQYSHEAERELCERCGDALSLYAEVFSFTGLARRVLQQQGGLAADWLDKGGRLLCMALALDQISSRLRLYGAAARRAELQSALLAAVDECKSAAVDAPALAAASALAEGELADKLADLSLVLEAYDAVVARGHADPTDRLDLLADKLGGSGIGKTSRVYLDGFIDFTRQEQRVIRALLETGAEVTVCLTLDDLHGDDEVFALSRTAAGRLCALAGEKGCAVQIERMDVRGDKGGALDFFTDNLFSYSPARWEGETDAIRLCAAPGLTAECELAAATAISLVRDRGCRWRDIAVAVRGFEDYRRTLQSVFAHYGVPLYTARKSELLSKSIPALISAAYAIVCGGTGLYMDSLIKGETFAAPSRPAQREYVEHIAEEKGMQFLYDMLMDADPETAEKLHVSDRKRIVRAMEVFLITGMPLSYHNAQSRLKPPKYSPVWLGLNFRDRAKLYERVDRRVEQMMAQGLEAEVRTLLDRGIDPASTAMQAIGYKELAAALRGECSTAQAVAQIQQASRNYAKRQLTWFRRNEAIHWLYADEEKDLRAAALRAIQTFTPHAQKPMKE